MRYCINDKMEYKTLIWWNSLPQEDKDLFIEKLYKHSEDMGFYYNENKEHYEYID